jgi:hypothetical protein
MPDRAGRRYLVAIGAEWLLGQQVRYSGYRRRCDVSNKENLSHLVLYLLRKLAALSDVIFSLFPLLNADLHKQQLPCCAVE